MQRRRGTTAKEAKPRQWKFTAPSSITSSDLQSAIKRGCAFVGQVARDEESAACGVFGSSNDVANVVEGVGPQFSFKARKNLGRSFPHIVETDARRELARHERLA